MRDQEQLRVKVNCQQAGTIDVTVSSDQGCYCETGMKLQLKIQAADGPEHKKDQRIELASIKLDIEEQEDWNTLRLSKEQPVRVFLPMEKPAAMTAIYLFSPWWTRPAFISEFNDIPALTQVLLLKYEDHCECLLPMVGDKWKTAANGGTDDEICLEMISGVNGMSHIDEPLYILAEAETVQEAVHAAMACAAEYLGIRPRSGRALPAQFRYLGWCSWDAFYTDVDEAGLRAKAAELAEKSVPVRWMIIDDGWMSTEGRYLTDYRPDPVKFPDGFRPMIADIRKSSMIRWFGVWHALGGYWSGVRRDTELASRQREYLRSTACGTLVPDHENGAGFYRDWYRYLRSEDIDFVKVDGQGSAAIHYENTVPISEAARGMSQALEAGAYLMDDVIINCMGMPMENVLGRTVSAVSRNSDDFFPSREESFVEHLLQNAYNSLYHDEIYCCDWDMFWTSHPYGRKHSLLRAISGGPVYFSDRVGETDPSVLKPLSYLDGELLMMDRSAKPTEDCIFTDPLKEGVIKLHNAVSYGSDGSIAGGIAVFNLTDRTQEYSFTAGDIPELRHQGPCPEDAGNAGVQTSTSPEDTREYCIYDYFGRTASVLGEDGKFSGTLEPGGYAWYVIIPAGRRVTCFGRTDKYAGSGAVMHQWESEDRTTFLLKETGPSAWISSAPPERVECNGEDVTSRVIPADGVYTLEIEEQAGPMTLTIFN